MREAGLEESIELDSAGTGAWHVGSPPDERATAAARARGIALEGAARQVGARTSTSSTCVLAMDRSNLAELRRSRPTSERAREVRLLREFDPASAGSARTSTCPTPTTAARGGFEEVLDLVQAACEGLLAEIRAGEVAVSLPPGADETHGASAAATSTRPGASRSPTAATRS